MNCPHCTKDIPGAVTSDDLRDRLKAKDEHAALLKTDLTAAQAKVAELEPKVAGLATLETELARTRGDLTKLTQAQERTAALETAKVPAALRARVIACYDADMAGKTGADVAAFDAWLNGPAREDPLLALAFTAAAPPAVTPPATPPGTPPPAVTPPAAKPPGTPVTPPTPPTPPPVQQAAMTPSQLQAYFQSPAFKGLSRDKQREKMAELQAAVPQDAAPAT